MRRFLEPIAGFILSMASWEVWTNFAVSMLVAFFGGILAYFGKWISARIIRHFSEKRNVYVSKTRNRINAHRSPDEDVIF